MFKNASIYRLPAPWAMTADTLAAALVPQAFTPCSSLEMQSAGWVVPRSNGMLVHTVNRQFLLMLQTETKILPGSVINQVTKARAVEIEEQQGFAPSRKQLREIKEDVTDELLPRAFSRITSMLVWIDPVNGWLVCDAATPARAEVAIKLLIKAIDKFPLETLRTHTSPVVAMTGWLLNDEAPASFTVDQDTELRSTGEGKATVRYIRHTLEADTMRHNIEAGKQCTRLAMTWADKISFVLTEGLTIKRIAALDVLKEDTAGSTKNDDERFDGDFVLMAGELNKMFGEIIAALGGELTEMSTPTATATEHTPQTAAVAEVSDDNLYDQAVAIVLAQRRASVSLVQRHLRIGYNRAARLLEEMEQNGIVSVMQSTGQRNVLVTA